jgi:hypothetical protein
MFFSQFSMYFFTNSAVSGQDYIENNNNANLTMEMMMMCAYDYRPRLVDDEEEIIRNLTTFYLI